MNSNFRSASGWKDSAYNSLSASYSYGYAGARSDLPATGYDPVYPSTNWTSGQQSNYSYTPTYQQEPSRQPTAPYQQLQYQAQAQEYNPEFPSYSYEKPQYSQESNRHLNTSFISVNSSAFSLRNALSAQQKQNSARRSFPRKSATNQTPPRNSGARPVSNLIALNRSTPRGSKSTRGSRASSSANRSQQIVSLTDSPVKKDSDSDIVEIKSSGAQASLSSTSTVKIPTSKAKNRSGRGGMRQQRGGATAGGGVNKRRSMESNSGQPGGRGAFGGRGRGHRGGRGFGRRGRGPPRPSNKQDDIPFVPLGEGEPTISLVMDPENLVCFHGPSSVFTTQHTFPVLIDGKIYESIDHYYQIQKVKDLCGSVSEKLTETVRDASGKRVDGKVGFRARDEKSFSQIARESCKLANIEKSKIDEWRNTSGLQAIQNGFYAKISQSAHLREAIKDTGNKILVHAYAGDSIYGTGTTYPQIRKWCEDMKGNGNRVFRIPATFPLTSETIKGCPNFANGRNVLGVILMQLREMLTSGSIEVVDMSSVFDTLKSGVGASGIPDADLLMDVADGVDGFAIGGGSVQAKIGTA